jgi:ferric-dicitrate binding protein FerR (iron transport regulator)
MTRAKPSRFDELQTRFAAGETLSAEEEALRQAEASRDPLAARELELFRELAHCMTKSSRPSSAREAEQQGASSFDADFVDRVLAEAGVRPRPRLRVVRDGEQAASSAPRRRTAALAWGAAAAGSALLVTALAFVAREEPPPNSALLQAGQPPPAAQAAPARTELVLAAGEVWVGTSKAAVGQGTLTSGNRLRTEAGRACVTIDPGIDVCVGERAELVLESLEPRSLRLRVERGLAVASLAPRRPGEHFALVSGELSARAVGTVFALEKSAAGADVLVADGKVEVSRGGAKPTLVSAHGRLLASSATPEAMGRSEEARLHALLAPRELWRTQNLATLEVTGDDSAMVEVGGREPLATPLSVFVPPGRQSLSVRNQQTGAVTTLELTLATGERRRVELPTARAASAAKPPVVPPSAALLLEQARRELRKGNPEAALETYRKLERAFPNGPEAATVLVTVGKLELDAGSAARALSSFDRYLERGGPLAQEALAGRIRALRKLGRAREERAAIVQFLADYPSGFDASTLRKRLDALPSP